MRVLIVVFFVAFSGLVAADTSETTSYVPLELAPQTEAERLIAPIELHTVEELESMLTTVESRYSHSRVDGPVMMVLHGSEINTFIKDNYSRYQSVVQKSTELTEKGVVQIEICERWLDANNISRSRLQPFVKTVEYGPARLQQLVNDQYTYF